jgi:hypothetical protein
MQAEKEAQPEQLQIERHLHQASVREGRENASVFPAAEVTQHHQQLRSICRLLSRYRPWLSNISDLDSSSPR